MRTMMLVTLGLVGCTNLAGQIEGNYVGNFVLTSTTDPIGATDYAVTATQVNKKTIAISGEDFTTFEVSLADAIVDDNGAIGVVDGAAILFYEADTLEVTYEAPEGLIAFQGTRVE